MERTLAEEVANIPEKKQGAFLLRKYKKGKATFEQITKLEVPVGEKKESYYYPNLYLVYRYVLLKEKILSKKDCVKIYRLIPCWEMDAFWRVLRKNLHHVNILLFIETLFNSEIFLWSLFSELKTKQIKQVAQHLAGVGVGYAEQIGMYLNWTEDVSETEYKVVTLLARLGNLDMKDVIEDNLSIQEYLYPSEEEIDDPIDDGEGDDGEYFSEEEES